jgi:hypothetical protein
MKFFTAFVFFGLSLNTYAFTMNNSVRLVFTQDEVKVNVAAATCNNIGINEEEVLSIVGDAVARFWNTAPTSRLKLRKGSVIPVSGLYATDTICEAATNCEPNAAIAVASDILITCNSNLTNFSSSAILAVTIPNNIAGTRIVGSLVMLNDHATTQFDTKSREEKVSIIAHELGHAFGLGHSPVTDSLMYFATREQRKALGRDDIDGISYLYPKQQPVGGGCGSMIFDGKNKPGPWPGLFIGFFIIFMAEVFRKNRKSKT